MMFEVEVVHFCVAVSVPVVLVGCSVEQEPHANVEVSYLLGL